MWQGNQTLAPATPAKRAGNERVAPAWAPRPPRASRGRRRSLAAVLAAALGLPALPVPLSPPFTLTPAAPLAALAALAVGGCQADPEPDRQPRLGAEAEWAWLLAAKRRLDAERAQLEALGGAGATPAPPPPPPPTAAAASSPRDRLALEVDALAQQLGRRLVA